jgi:hypothetical protein
VGNRPPGLSSGLARNKGSGSAAKRSIQISKRNNSYPAPTCHLQPSALRTCGQHCRTALFIRRLRVTAFTKSAKTAAALIDDLLRGSTLYHNDALDRLTQVDGPIQKPLCTPLRTIFSAVTQNPTQALRHTIVSTACPSMETTTTVPRTRQPHLTARGKQLAIKQHLHYKALNQSTSVEV